MQFPVAQAALGWFLFCAILIILIAAGRFLKWVNKDNAEIAYVFIVTAGISTFMLWMCAWMQQWHPLLSPIVAASTK